MNATAAAAPEQDARTLTALVYSDNPDVRSQVRMAVGRRPAVDLPEVTWIECATPGAVVGRLADGGVDLVVLDGEASPFGGLGLCRQVKNEIYRCPPVLVLTGRPQDSWLAAWSLADNAVCHPLDPAGVADAVAGLVRGLGE
jgi:DNA-binding response OmpR family regulator